MQSAQSGILAEETQLARYLGFSIQDMDTVSANLQQLAEIEDQGDLVVGIGLPTVQALDKDIDGLRVFPAGAAAGIEMPSTPIALWCWLRGNDRGQLFHRSRQIQEMLEPGFVLIDSIDSFQYDANRDLSGYEDGTENPAGDEAITAAIVQGAGDGMDGSSFVAVQQWLHDFEALDTMSTAERDDVIGRHIADNEEFDEAPESAHVKRSAQESFSPEAFMLRRSMPWVEGSSGGLVFVAFGKSFDAYEAILGRMMGEEDGITDGLFSFTRPITGAYFWCPPVKNNKLDMQVLGI